MAEFDKAYIGVWGGDCGFRILIFSGKNGKYCENMKKYGRTTSVHNIIFPSPPRLDNVFDNPVDIESIIPVEATVIALIRLVSFPLPTNTLFIVPHCKTDASYAEIDASAAGS